MQDATPRLVNALIAEGRQQEAIALLDGLRFADAPAPPNAAALIGAAWCRLGRPDRALPFLARDWGETDPEAAGMAGAALLSLAYLEPALLALRRAVDQADPQGAHWVNYGRALALSGQVEQAIAPLRRGSERLGGTDPLALQALAEALLALGRVEEAVTAIPDRLDSEPLALARGAVLAACGRHPDAATWLEQARSAWPDSTPLLLMSADLAEVRGRTTEVETLLRRALQGEPENVLLWARLARSGRRGRSREGARAAADKALALTCPSSHTQTSNPTANEDGAGGRNRSPGLRSIALAAHAHVLAEEGDTAGAEAAYQEALALHPFQIAALSGLGQLLLQLGRVEEAMHQFERVQAIAPLQGWSQLIQARRVPEDPAVLASMEAAARQPSLEGPVRASLLFTLAAAYDRIKDPAQALALAEEANRVTRALLPYDPAAHRRRIEAEMARFSLEFMATRRDWGDASDLPVFVLGMPRSGTTLVEQIIASHSQVFGAGELGQIPALIARLQAWEAHLGSGLPYPSLLCELGASRCRRLAGEVLRELREKAPQARRIVDKLPHNFEHVGLIKLFFPNAFILHVRREPRDIAVSNYLTDYAAKFGGMGFAYDLTWIGQQLADHERLMTHWHTTFPGQILDVPYESLVEDTEGWARRMIEHLGLAWEPGVLAYQDLERSVKTASVWQVRQPIYKTSRERWRRYADALGPVEAALGETLAIPAPWPVPDHAPDLFLEGMAQLQAHQPALAEEAFLRLIAAHPQHAAAYQFLGAAHLALGRPEEAVRAMRQALQWLPIHPSWHENLARALLANQDAPGARAALNRARALRAAAGARAEPDAEASVEPTAEPRTAPPGHAD